METIIFGPADFAASTEMPVLTGGVQIPEYPGDHFHYVFSKILMAGRANGLQVIDGPFLKIRELDALRDYAMRTRILGYDGKWALHPDQVAVINEVFTPTQEQFDHAFDILEAYEKATTEGDRRGAVMFGDEMIDEASRKMAMKFVSRGERAGMTRSSSSSPHTPCCGALARDEGAELGVSSRAAAFERRPGARGGGARGRRAVNAHGTVTGSTSCRRERVQPEDLALDLVGERRVAELLLELLADLEGAERLDLVLRRSVEHGVGAPEHVVLADVARAACRARARPPRVGEQRPPRRAELGVDVLVRPDAGGRAWSVTSRLTPRSRVAASYGPSATSASKPEW